MKKAEFIARYGEEAYQRLSERSKQRYQDNKEEMLERQKQYYQDNKEEKLEYQKQYSQNNKEKIAEYRKQYQQTQYGRAANLCSTYQQADKNQNRGGCTLTADYIVDHIFPNGCLYCGETDWRKLGCDRVDNDLPHTPDNVVCCCADCNRKKHLTGFNKFLNMAWRKRFS